MKAEVEKPVVAPDWKEAVIAGPEPRKRNIGEFEDPINDALQQRKDLKPEVKSEKKNVDKVKAPEPKRVKLPVAEDLVGPMAETLSSSL